MVSRKRWNGTCFAICVLTVVLSKRSAHALLSPSLPPPELLAKLLQQEMSGERDSPTPILLPCCYDGLTARLVARAGFEATFMSGFGVSGAYQSYLVP